MNEKIEQGSGSPFRGARRLHRGHFAFMRALVQGVDPESVGGRAWMELDP